MSGRRPIVRKLPENGAFHNISMNRKIDVPAWCSTARVHSFIVISNPSYPKSINGVLYLIRRGRRQMCTTEGWQREFITFPNVDPTELCKLLALRRICPFASYVASGDSGTVDIDFQRILNSFRWSTDIFT